MSVPIAFGVGLTGSLAFGTAVDLHGNYALYVTGSFGGQVGGGVFGGVSVGISPWLDNVSQIQGWGYSAGIAAAAGEGLTGE